MDKQLAVVPREESRAVVLSGLSTLVHLVQIQELCQVKSASSLLKLGGWQVVLTQVGWWVSQAAERKVFMIY